MNPVTQSDLPDPFRFADSTRVHTPADWERRRVELADLIVPLEYGGLPARPASTRHELLHSATVKGSGGVRIVSLRVVAECERPFGFLLQLLVPPGEGPFPVVLTGDACWRYVTDPVAADVVGRGLVLAQFNRVEIASDTGGLERSSGVYAAGPDGVYGALSAWAWGYHRCVDVLGGMAEVDAARIGIVGHSRGGKATLLAGATDPRIALTCANGSGCGGAGCFRVQGAGSEQLGDILRLAPYWFGSGMAAYIGREADLPFDQHFLMALIAPRALLTTEALGDLWANPTGTLHTHLAARAVYRFLGAEDRLGIWFREGEHEHCPGDWGAFLDFFEWTLCGRPTERRFDRNPFA